MTDEDRMYGDDFYIRKLNENDASVEYCNWLNDPEVSFYLETRKATKVFLDYAFNKIGLIEVELGVLGDNKRAQKSFERAGFKFVDIQKNAINHDGVLHDKVIMTVKKP